MIVAVIPARGGSRGLARKNLRRIGGRSLVELTVLSALASRSVQRVVVSTDDDEIADLARRSGAEVPFRRPAELATDEATTVDVVRHAVQELERAGASIDLVVTLQPTSPLRSSSEIDAAVALLHDARVDSAVSVAPLSLPWSVVGYVEDGLLVRGPQHRPDRRQASPSAVRVTGAVYVTRRALLEEGLIIGSRAAALMTSGPSTIDIDDMTDLRRARRAHRVGGVG